MCVCVFSVLSNGFQWVRRESVCLCASPGVGMQLLHLQLCFFFPHVSEVHIWKFCSIAAACGTVEVMQRLFIYSHVI
jgi:hypothetical protein